MVPDLHGDREPERKLGDCYPFIPFAVMAKGDLLKMCSKGDQFQ
jgi:hypothetical protein